MGVIEVYSFAPSISNKITTADNITVCNNLNIQQLRLDINNPYFDKLFIFWYKDIIDST